MPKGDRFKLKADPEDGTTPIANLLLEAVAMAKLSGLQKGCLLHLWRETYGWVGEDGNRRKEAKITLSEWSEALASTNPRISQTLADLERHHVIIRRMTDAWGGYHYSINTQVSTWNRDCINHTKLCKYLKIPDFSDITEKNTVTENGIVTVTHTVIKGGNSYPHNNGTVTENITEQLPKTELPTLYKEILNKYKERGDVKSPPLPADKNNSKIREVFANLDKLRGYRPPKRKAEAAAILRMLKTYAPDDIIGTWQTLKQDKFYQGKELYMMTVEGQIGAILAKGNQKASQSISGKYGHVVQR